MNNLALSKTENAERFTPEQRADAIIQVLYADTPPPLWFELRDSIAAEIREAVELEREACARLAEQLSTDNLYPYPDACGSRIIKAIRRG